MLPADLALTVVCMHQLSLSTIPQSCGVRPVAHDTVYIYIYGVWQTLLPRASLHVRHLSEDFMKICYYGNIAVWVTLMQILSHASLLCMYVTRSSFVCTLRGRSTHVLHTLSSSYKFKTLLLYTDLNLF